MSQISIQAPPGTGVIVTAPTVHTPSGTTVTIDWDDGYFQIIDAGSASGNITVTLSNPVDGAPYELWFIQGATARTLTLPSTVKFSEGRTPAQSSANNARDRMGGFYSSTEGVYCWNYSPGHNA